MQNNRTNGINHTNNHINRLILINFFQFIRKMDSIYNPQL